MPLPLTIANKENNGLFPLVYPSPTLGQACAVIVRVSQHLLLPRPAKKQNNQTERKEKTTPSPPDRTRDKEKKQNKGPLLLHCSILHLSHLLHLGLQLALFLPLGGRGLSPGSLGAPSAVGSMILHRAAPVLLIRVGPLVPTCLSTCGVWVWRAVVGCM